jgi:hypothetical protein
VGTWLSFVNGSFAGAVCLAVTIVLLILSAVAWKKKGARSGIRGIAWSLLPLAAYLTHALGLLGRIVSAIVQFAGSFVFSPKAWLGVILVGISALLFLLSGGIPFVGWRRRRKKAKAAKQKAAAAGYAPASVPPSGRQQVQAPQARPADDDDMREVQDILRKRGIS